MMKSKKEALWGVTEARSEKRGEDGEELRR